MDQRCSERQTPLAVGLHVVHRLSKLCKQRPLLGGSFSFVAVIVVTHMASLRLAESEPRSSLDQRPGEEREVLRRREHLQDFLTAEGIIRQWVNNPRKG